MKNNQMMESHKSQTENLKCMLRSFGINTPEELDAALSKVLGDLTIAIMTEVPLHTRNTA